MKQLEAAFKSVMEKTEGFTPAGLFRTMEPAFEAEGFRDESRSIKNILVIHLCAIGDMIVSTGFIRELRRNFPLARIDVVATPLVAPLMEVCPHVDEVFSFNPDRILKDFKGGLEDMGRFCRSSLWPQQYELCLCPQWGGEKDVLFLLAYLSGAENRVGYDQAIGAVYYPGSKLPPEWMAMQEGLRIMTFRTPPEVIHEAARSVYLLKLLGLRVEDESLEAWIGEKERARARRWLAPYEGKLLVSLGIGAGIPNRKYPVEKYQIALDEIRHRYRNVVFVVLGGASEHEDGKYLARTLPAGRLVDMTQKTTLRESAAILAETAFYMGNNTGLMHMAAAAGRPVIMTCQEPADWIPEHKGLHSLVARFSPWQVPSVILQPDHAIGACANSDCYGGCLEQEFPHCIAAIEPEAIVKAFDDMMEAMGKS